jgi:hypothetical protein
MFEHALPTFGETVFVSSQINHCFSFDFAGCASCGSPCIRSSTSAIKK